MLKERQRISITPICRYKATTLIGPSLFDSSLAWIIYLETIYLIYLLNIAV